MASRLNKKRSSLLRWPALYLQMLRIRVAFMLILFALLGVVSSGSITNNYLILPTIIVLASWYVHATTTNDISDVKIDKINLKQAKGRPLVHDTANVTDLVILNVISGLAAIMFSLVIGHTVVIITAIGIILNYMYSLRPFLISHKGYIAPLLLPIGYVTIPFLIGVQLTDEKSINISLLTSVYVAFIGRIILKDFRDIKGDKKFGKRTFVVMHGKLATLIVSTLAWTCGYILLLFALNEYAFRMSILIAPSFIAILYVLYLIHKEKSFTMIQKYIGMLARSANTIVICLSAYYLITVQETDVNPLTVVATIQLLSLYTLYINIRDPKQVQINYKG